MEAIGKKIWVIPEGYIPSSSQGPSPQMTSHETACILNTGSETAHIHILVFYTDKPPTGPYEVSIAPERTQHVRFNDLKDPEPIPTDTDYASVIVSDVPIVVQHSRLDSRQEANALMSTIAYPVS